MLALSRRERVLCACLLAMIIAVSTAAGAMAWRTLQDEQVQLQGPSVANTGATDEHSIETDLTSRDSFDLTRPASPGGTASSGSGRSGPSLQTSQPTTVDGTAVAAVVTVVLLGAAAGAARLVLARYRREGEQSEAAVGAGRPLLDLDGEEPDADAEEADADAPGAAQLQDAMPHEEVEASEQPLPLEERQQPATTDAPVMRLSGLIDPDEPLVSGPLLEVQPTAPSETQPLLEDLLIPAPRAISDAWQEAPVGSGSPPRPLGSPLLEEPSSFAAPAVAASENIFDRRTARRVPYVEAARLWWGESHGSVMVQDLSATGLRLRFPSPASTQQPALGQSLRICFPAGGREVQANGRVQWRRTVDGATEVGLQFLDLPAAEQELIQSVLLAAE